MRANAPLLIIEGITQASYRGQRILVVHLIYTALFTHEIAECMKRATKGVKWPLVILFILYSYGRNCTLFRILSLT